MLFRSQGCDKRRKRGASFSRIMGRHGQGTFGRSGAPIRQAKRIAPADGWIASRSGPSPTDRQIIRWFGSDVFAGSAPSRARARSAKDVTALRPMPNYLVPLLPGQRRSLPKPSRCRASFAICYARVFGASTQVIGAPRSSGGPKHPRSIFGPISRRLFIG